MIEVHERLDPETAEPDVYERHVDRYDRAIGLAREHGHKGGVWWDVACGYGYGTVRMLGEVVVGIDRDPQTVRAAEARYPDVTFGVADVTRGGWAAEFAHLPPDVVLSVETLEHLDIFGQHAFLTGAAAALRKRGLLVLACPLNEGTPSNNPWHKREPTEAQLRALLAAHFGRILHFETEEYVSTSGPAVQAFAVAR